MRWIVAGLLTLHGLIHLMGFAKAFGYAELPQLTQPLSREMGLLWLAAGLLVVASAVVMAVALMMVWPRRGAIGGRPLVGLLIAMLVWTLAYACEAMVVGENAKIFFGTLGYPGAMSVPVFFFLFVVEYTQSEKWAPQPRWLLWIVPVCCVIAAATNSSRALASWHHDDYLR